MSARVFSLSLFVCEQNGVSFSPGVCACVGTDKKKPKKRRRKTSEALQRDGSHLSRSCLSHSFMHQTLLPACLPWRCLLACSLSGQGGGETYLLTITCKYVFFNSIELFEEAEKVRKEGFSYRLH
mmetsp:Transcript_14601/g.29413  ORF Transcript_14601/g.29413 Transcript_14601/m.29413 type:complete len:125 (+) Transcript_14601:1165-1539(+)